MKKVVILVLVIILIFPISGICNNTQNKLENKVYKLAYVEGESYEGYSQRFYAINKAFSEMGLVNEEIQNVTAWYDSKSIYEYLRKAGTESQIQYVENGFFRLTDYEDESQMIQAIKEVGDVDLIIVMGTAAGIALSNSDISNNIFSFGATDAVGSGIIQGDEDSGKDHLWAHVDPDRFQRQMEIFHDIIDFKKIGVVYENSDIARNYSAIDDIKTVSEKLGFEVVEYYVDEPAKDGNEYRYYSELEQAYEKLANEVDAFYLTVASIKSEWLEELLEPFENNNVPVLSQLGDAEVEHGALMSINVIDIQNEGRFGANQILHCLKGEKPRELEQVFVSAPKISLNSGTARKINFKIPFDFLLIVDEIYSEDK